MDPTPEDAVRALRAAAEAHLVVSDGDVRRVRYVIDRRRGLLLLPIPADLTELAEAQLLIPSEQTPVVTAMITIQATSSPPADAEIRFEIYHGQAREATWALAAVEAVRYHGEAFDGEEIELTDEIIADEPDLCRRLNAAPNVLRDLCARFARAAVERPVAVGVDPDGIDVRARFGIVRVEFDEPARNPEQARERIADLTARSRA
ncbi:MAG TPA: DUF2470 domain-containing protein [Phycisphaerales bacterium]|nr:DUF2470 domain-containing protein [Phycisphaerales bacterium]